MEIEIAADDGPQRPRDGGTRPRTPRALALYAAGAVLLGGAVAGAIAVSSRQESSPGSRSQEIVVTPYGPAVRLARSRFTWTVRKQGQLKPLDEHSITVRTWGVITRIWEDGQPVKKGDVILELDRRDIERRIADREADVAIRNAELVQTERNQAKRVKAAEDACKKSELELEWQRLSEKILLAGPSSDELARADKELAARELVAKNRAEELRILEELASQGFATDAEVERKRLQLAEAKLDLDKHVFARQRLLDGPSAAEKKEAALRVQIASYSLESDRRKLESVRTMARSEIALAEQRLKNEENALAQDREDLEKYTIRSPADGYILYARPQWGEWTPGRQVWRGVKVMSVPASGRMKVVTAVEQTEVDQVLVGSRCRVLVAAKPSVAYDAEVILVSRQGRDAHEDLDGYTKDKVGKAGRQSFEVEAKLLTEDRDLRPNFRAEVEFVLAELPDALVVPWGAVRKTAEGARVTVIGRSGPVERTVELGYSNETSVVVASGVSEGELVLVAHGG